MQEKTIPGPGSYGTEKGATTIHVSSASATDQATAAGGSAGLTINCA